MTPATRLGVRLLVALGVLAGAGRAGATPSEPSTLGYLADDGALEVTLDVARFAAERVAVIRIVNKRAWVVQGQVPACLTIFTTGDPGDSPVRPAESGAFIVPARSEVRLIRPFRLVDPSKRPPGRGVYRLNDDALPEPGCRD